MTNLYSTVGTPPLFSVSDRARGRIDLATATRATAHIFVLEDDILRVLVLPGGELRQPASWAIAPGLEDVPAVGRDRYATTGFTCPEFTLQELSGELRIETARVRLTVELRGLLCQWDLLVDGQWRRVARDRR